MQSFIISIMAMAGVAFAAPAAVEARSSLCPHTLYSVPQCCSPNVLNILSLDCTNPVSAYNSWDFKNSCASNARESLCCTIPLAGQGVLCISAL
ncbi:hypothetical protein E4U31_000937 [Claviceps sp. LM219 group G6]|uniref:Hydrophobin n=1 Tax=Claviceps arundinis TaxID=1623583 RepID=A0A9P7MX30_9HYPO|nr:hypothetical protein E4U56_005307 [Claviceps arundinis]KAG6090448.1 hypothetical protein E4U15_005040 [Claviceps sp. LM218 group G6]KAG6113387.1 hypothetical protein E4U31_000937 [Claviceps sp. LM219 group G6]KAG6122717.1 hypothetical protein E4U14_004840 [Claviceps sp. LM454 group G7]